MVEYVEAVFTIPRPSSEQVTAFIDYVARAHSWYKHLPPVPPGQPFYFYLDPYAGYSLVVGPWGSKYRYRDKAGFHYSDIPTAEYRQSFGALQYSSGAGTAFLFPDAEGAELVSAGHDAPSTSEDIGGLDLPPVTRRPGVLEESSQKQGPAIQGTGRKRIRVPDEILRAGCVELTGAIHPVASSTWFWKWFTGPKSRTAELIVQNWPSETGGREAAFKVLDIARSKPGLGIGSEGFTELYGDYVAGFDSRIHSLVDLERRRLKKLMEEAIYRVLQRVYC